MNIRELKKEQQRLSIAINADKTQLDSLKSEKGLVSAELLKVNDELKKANIEFESLKDSLSKEIKIIEKEKKRLENENKILLSDGNNEENARARKIISLDNTIKEKVGEESRLVKVINVLRGQKEKLDEKNLSLIAKGNLLTSKTEDAIKLLKVKKEGLEDSRNILIELNEKLKKDNNNEENYLKTIKKEVANLEKQEPAIKDNIKKLKSEIAKEEDALANILKEKKINEDEANKAKKQVQSIRDERARINQKEAILRAKAKEINLNYDKI